MFGFVKKVSVSLVTFFSGIALSATPLKCFNEQSRM